MDELDLAYREDIKERYWDAYLTDCQAEEKIPNYKSFLIWLEENDLV